MSTAVTIRLETEHIMDTKEDMKDWCYLNVGSVESWHYVGFIDGYLRFRFEREEDATAFKLRFSL
jgi:hypothetical protein